MSTRRPARLWLGFLTSVVCLGIVVATPSAASALVGQLAIKNVPYIQTAGTGDSYARASTEIGTTVYVGGTFSQVFEPLSGTNYARPDLFAYNETSKLVSPFAPSFNGQVWGLAHSPDGQYLYAAGNFSTVNGLARKGLVQFDLSTGTVTAFNAHLDGQARTVDYVGTHLIVGGAFVHVNGVSRVALATTGYKNSSGPLTATVCDAVARFSASVVSGGTPTWVNYTGCDSLYSVLVAADAVYVGGHNRWLNNPNACDSAGPGSVSRPGIGAVDPTTGQALPWDPTRSRGRGADFLEMTTKGLAVLSDCAAAGITGDSSSGANYLAYAFHPCYGVLLGS